MAKQIVLSGIQPSGQLHIGNYLGSIRNWLELQDKYECYFFIADYHSITEDYDPKEKREQIYNLMADYLAAGLDPKKCTLFIQSDVQECTELAWIFNTITPVSELERMTQFKDKSERQKKNINMGLFDYPVLQAADILMYKTEKVPVGQDQVQHVELTRKIARWFNIKFGDTFPEPESLLTETPKIMSLQEPEKKMSKSLGPKHYISINEEPESIKDKLKKAVADEKGLKNLYSLAMIFIPNFNAENYKNNNLKLKQDLAEAIAKYFTDFRKKRKKLEKDKKYLEKVMETGAKKAQKEAQKTMAEVKEKIGLIT